MSLWNDIVSTVNKLPGASTVNRVGGEAVHDIGSFLGSQNAAPGIVTGGQPETFSQLGNQLSSGLSSLTGGGGSSAPTDPAATQTQNILNSLNGLTYGQEQGQGAAQLAKQLAVQLQALPAADAEKIIKQLGNTTLATDVQNDISPQQQSNTNPYGFDPLSLGKIFSQSIAPFLQQQEGLANTESNNLAAQMKSALSGASPAMQQAYGVAIPELQDANVLANSAAAQEVGTAPEFDNFIQQLTNATNAAKLAQAAAANEPYVAATVQGGALPTTGAYGPATQNAQAIVNQLYQSTLNPAAATG